MNDREVCRERVRDIRATSTIWWWWYIYRMLGLVWGIIYFEPSKFVSASYGVSDSEFDHLWGGRSGEGSMMLQDPKLPNDPGDQTSLTTPTGADLSAYIYIYILWEGVICKILKIFRFIIYTFHLEFVFNTSDYSEHYQMTLEDVMLSEWRKVGWFFIPAWGHSCVEPRWWVVIQRNMIIWKTPAHVKNRHLASDFIVILITNMARSTKSFPTIDKLYA